MKDKIIKRATDMFLKLGFKSVTMDDIACEMCISKKTIYKYFGNKEMLIEEGTEVIHQKINDLMERILNILNVVDWGTSDDNETKITINLDIIEVCFTYLLVIFD